MNLLSSLIKSGKKGSSQDKVRNEEEELRKLLKFIKSEKKKGKTDNEIKEVLVSKGLDNETTEKIFNDMKFVSENKGVIYCSGCGTKNILNAKFCNSCGVSLKKGVLIEQIKKETEDSGDKWANAGIFCAFLSIFLIPLLFALLGIICGCVAMYKGKVGKGLSAVILSIVLGFIGIILGIISVFKGWSL